MSDQYIKMDSEELLKKYYYDAMYDGRHGLETNFQGCPQFDELMRRLSVYDKSIKPEEKGCQPVTEEDGSCSGFVCYK